jgi:hypothetical protein
MPDRMTEPATDEDQLFAMVNLAPRLTGLPMTVWVRPESGLQNDVRIKVNMTHGRAMSISNTAVFAVQPTARLVSGHLSSADFAAVSDWISLNKTAIVDYWNLQTDTDEFLQRLQQLPP